MLSSSPSSMTGCVKSPAGLQLSRDDPSSSSLVASLFRARLSRRARRQRFAARNSGYDEERSDNRSDDEPAHSFRRYHRRLRHRANVAPVKQEPLRSRQRHPRRVLNVGLLGARCRRQLPWHPYLAWQRRVGSPIVPSMRKVRANVGQLRRSSAPGNGLSARDGSPCEHPGAAERAKTSDRPETEAAQAPRAGARCRRPDHSRTVCA